ncbi:MAG: bifunctional 4-hydroxy-2-oxoglutarate aldolase/2-dehydro-3-deoxy-phosphogluconate aldolase [Eubacteriales bacterium]|jgi:2-dehydro-3-deoxyphosphogluconate aldolase/4-hydroxy-2-oxoglutarate aldolase|nr:bifunctional 4-hydroxy-2-oxoglutarate aldolase/2-dehydro-3-deoxy-phosphogluconate aldolase [Clostridium sp.]MCI6215450.1 bifunctional 4-hydroxy-2-oxoglutarate aldolase/2-dehydro-3-deoxy-phosphogluconate aldolase [Clostridiales bacterium]MDY2972187.1 bifunctional 4-hydroxy-2-oxoglutarate aldolase/2-dehydro-3-deoxy-phosphogluconate aldolase [Eubacteriales bacterium]MEE0400033.1 bifunctional 4-hydroxy-2-oxoglutarate aldolase/2-dehydro-3-deoxy-phosphogluconate aldolase [Christensenellales bacteri
MKQVIPVVVINDEKETIEILSKLREGGINCAEITFRTACAKEAIAIGTKAFEDMNIGAGTVINAEQAKSAVQAGAKFIVSPGFSDEVARYCTDEKIPYYPGCVTPTEIMRALSYGLNVVKFFPAGVYGGLKAMKALSAPFPQVRFIPTGGVDLSNLKEYLDFDKVYAVGGSFMMKGDIVKNCKEIVKICEL